MGELPIILCRDCRPLLKTSRAQIFSLSFGFFFIFLCWRYLSFIFYYPREFKYSPALAIFIKNPVIQKEPFPAGEMDSI
jgi:hypothetical protein